MTNLKRRIAEAEMRSTAATDWLIALTRIGSDSVGVEQRLWNEMDALLALRQQLWKFQFPEGV